MDKTKPVVSALVFAAAGDMTPDDVAKSAGAGAVVVEVTQTAILAGERGVAVAIGLIEHRSFVAVLCRASAIELRALLDEAIRELEGGG